MTRLQSFVRAYAFEGVSPAMVLERTDRLAVNLSAAHLASVAYGRIVLDEPGALLTYSNAGHPPPIVADASGRVRVLDQARSTLVGAGHLLAAGRSTAGAVLPHGSTLVLYTDGVILTTRAGSALCGPGSSRSWGCCNVRRGPNPTSSAMRWSPS